jgi:mannosyltransferase OCH1-like enzyme
MTTKIFPIFYDTILLVVGIVIITLILVFSEKSYKNRLSNNDLFHIRAMPKLKTLIPFDAHFVFGLWSKGDLPSHFRETMDAWDAQGWRTHLWNKQSCELLLLKYPEYKTLYESFTRNVQKADFIRYLIVYDCGGAYFDLDCVPEKISLKEKIISKWTKRQSIYFVEHVMPETWSHQTVSLFPIRDGVPEYTERLSNFAFAAIKGHFSIKRILEKVVERCEEHPRPVKDADYFVLYTTGPSALTRAIQKLRERTSIEQLTIVPDQETNELMTHKCTGTWRRNADVP